MRAGEVIAGGNVARARRSGGNAPADRDLARGPARLAVALGLLREHNGLDAIWEGSPQALGGPPDGPLGGSPDGHGRSRALTGLPVGSVVLLEGHPPEPGAIRSGPRTGVSTAKDTPWRFWVEGDPTVSPYKAHAPRRRSTAATSVGEAPRS
jgi:DNA-3-methyladenine glycosylase